MGYPGFFRSVDAAVGVEEIWLTKSVMRSLEV